MGPQHKSCGEDYFLTFRPYGLCASMGPQHKSCGEEVAINLRDGVTPLQWGRSIRAAESGERIGQIMSREAASMGPQHKSCGELG